MQEGYPYFTSSEVLSTPTVIDLNNDGVINVLDIVALVSIVLGN